MSRLWSRQLSAPIVAFSPPATAWDGWRGDDCEVLVRSPGPAPSLAAAGQLLVEWSAVGVSLRPGASTEATSSSASAVLIHEPVPQLLAALPLRTLDPKARRMWAWVFFCVRVPGLRVVLRHIASRTRA